ncbi:Bacteriocin-like peptide J BlpJ [Streptococcus infantarius subsp. infantarius]|nr:Bacteriocin-like peptide J BlpJ [Streptococcus infantarius subsp. infantarius]MCO4610370.1 Bacteriocin-like peptide J BlpJ [Streptococcus infantarius subsp. infantarius]
MNTKAFEQFDVMTDEALSKVEGGNKCVNAIFGGALTGAGS